MYGDLRIPDQAQDSHRNTRKHSAPNLSTKDYKEEVSNHALDWV